MIAAGGVALPQMLAWQRPGAFTQEGVAGIRAEPIHPQRLDDKSASVEPKRYAGPNHHQGSVSPVGIWAEAGLQARQLSLALIGLGVSKLTVGRDGKLGAHVHVPEKIIRKRAPPGANRMGEI